MKKLIKTVYILLLLITGSIMVAEENKIAKSAEDICPVKIGTEILSALIKSINGNELDIKEIAKDQKSIIIFYRGGWCPYCNMHLSELQKIEDDIVKLGYKIIAISMDKPENLTSTITEHKMKYELYSDSKANACKEFGVAFKLPESEVDKLKSYHMDIENSSGESHHILPVPSLFLVDQEGIIQFTYVNVDYKVRMDASSILEIAGKF